MTITINVLVWTFWIVFIFLLEEGEGSPRHQEGGGVVFFFLIENPRRGGGGFARRGEGPGRVSAANWGRIGGGGLNILFWGPKCPPRCVDLHWDGHCFLLECD